VELDPVQKSGPEVLEFEKKCKKMESKGSNFGRDRLKPLLENLLHINFRVSKPNWRFSPKGGTPQHSYYLASHNDLVKF